MIYPLHPLPHTPANSPSALFPIVCRLLGLSWAKIPSLRPLFSMLCSLFSENTGGGVGPMTSSKAAGLRGLRPAQQVARLSSLSTAFTPNRPLTPLSTAFTHFNRGGWVQPPSGIAFRLSALGAYFQLSTV